MPTDLWSGVRDLTPHRKTGNPDTSLLHILCCAELWHSTPSAKRTRAATHSPKPHPSSHFTLRSPHRSIRPADPSHIIHPLLGPALHPTLSQPATCSPSSKNSRSSDAMKYPALGHDLFPRIDM